MRLREAARPYMVLHGLRDAVYVILYLSCEWVFSLVSDVLHVMWRVEGHSDIPCTHCHNEYQR